MSRTEPTEPQTGSAKQSSEASTTRKDSTRTNEEASQGSTTIAPQVVQKVVALAAREVSGIHAMGGGASRAFGAVRERIPGGGTAQTAGVRVEVGQKQAAIDLDVIVEYGASIVELTRAVRRNVITAVESTTGLDVTEVNIAVNDVHVPSDDAEEPRTSPSRVE